MKKFGIVLSDDGIYTLTTASKKGSSWRPASTKHYNVENKISRFFLLDKGIRLGLPTKWKKLISLVPLADQDSVMSHDLFQACILKTDLQNGKDLLKNNLIGIVSDDVFLASIPLKCHKNCPTSFLSIFACEDFYIIGLIINSKLIVSFRMHPAKPELLAAHIGRVERYWQIQETDELFPEAVFIFGKPELIPQHMFSVEPVIIQFGKKFDENLPALRGFGVALTGDNDHVPAFCLATPESSIRLLRSFLYCFSGLVFLLTILAVSTMFITDSRLDSKRKELSVMYEQKVTSSPKVKELITECHDLAEQYSLITRGFNNQTVWEQLLYAIAKSRPEGLTLNRVGCRPSGAKKGKIEVALAGYSTDKNRINQLLSGLRKESYIEEIRVATIERDPDNTRGERFTIVCTIRG